MSALTKITTRAKSLQKKHPNTQWTSLIKKASSELKAEGKIGKGSKKSKTIRKRKGYQDFGEIKVRTIQLNNGLMQD